jgi:minor extracellular serine protease Vpr
MLDLVRAVLPETASAFPSSEYTTMQTPRLSVLGFALTCLLAAPVIAGAGQRQQRYALILPDAPVAARLASRGELSASRARDASLRIEAAQQSVRRELARRGVRVTGAAKILLNAVFVELPESEAAKLQDLPGIRRTEQLLPMKLQLDQAAALVNAPAAWLTAGGLENAGSGIKIGIIDSGIDQAHPAFQDSSLAMPDGYPKCDGDDCNYSSNKVIAVRSYVAMLARGTASNPALDSRPDDLSARDHVGHGTAVAMIAAGLQTAGPAAVITGVAPKAYLGSYKVVGSPGVNDVTYADVMIAALEQAYQDGMDVVTLAIGSPAIFGPGETGAACGEADPTSPCDVRAQAIENAVAKGMVVAVAAGNDGDIGSGVNGEAIIPSLNTINTPGTAPSAITVGATSNAHTWYSSVILGDGSTLNALFGDGPRPDKTTDALPVRDVSTLGNDGLACAALPDGSLAGAIGLIQRGTCDFSTKVLFAQQAGALGVILFREQGGEAPFQPLGLSGTGIPTVVIGYTDGLNLKTAAAQTPPATAAIDPALRSVVSTPDIVAAFSSHGPSIGDYAIKPEIVAPGSDIYTATQKYDPNSVLYDTSGYTAVQGTSYAVPFVAGAVALVKQKNPGFSAAQLKSAVVNSGTSDRLTDSNGQPASVAAAGGGKLNVDAALRTDVTIRPATLSFGAVTPGSLPMSATLQVDNPANHELQVSVTPEDSRITLNTSQPGTIVVGLTGDQPAPGLYQGYISVKGGATDLRVPYLYAVGDGTPASILPLGGMGFDAVVGTQVVLIFKVVDRFGVPVRNADVRFQAPDGATIDQADAQTDIHGIGAARVTLGPQVGEQDFTATVTAAGQSLAILFWGMARPAPVIPAGGIVNNASFQPNLAVAPGSFVSIFGAGLSDAAKGYSTPNLPLSLAGVSVSFDVPNREISLPGRLTYVSPGQVDVQVPWGLQGETAAFVKVSRGGLSTPLYTLSLAECSPGIYEYSAGAAGPLIAAAQDAATLASITPANPAHRGERVLIYMNGLGPVDNRPQDGEPSPANPARSTRIAPLVNIGGKQAPVASSSLSPAMIALYRVEALVPQEISPGLQPVVVNCSGVSSRSVKLPIE